MQLGSEAVSALTDIPRLKFSGPAKFIGRRIVVPSVTNVAGKFGGPLVGLGAGTATRALLERFTKQLQESEEYK